MSLTRGTEAQPSPNEPIGRACRDRPWVIAGALLSVAIGLGVTAHAVFSPAVIEHYADSPDSVDITRFAQRATLADVPLWWSGAWIQRTSPYYRPLSSMAFWAEYLAFGWNFQGHVIISWLVHALVCYLLYRLSLQLLAGPTAPGAAFATLAVLVFNLRIGPSGPGWTTAPVSYGVVAWWPGQTDQFALLFAIPAIMSFDAWLTRERPNGLRLACLLWAVSLLFKEMAVSLPLVAGCLVLYREGLQSLRLWQTCPEEDNCARRFAPGLMWRVVPLGLVLVAGFLALRHAMVPGAWGPQSHGVGYFLNKAVWYGAQRAQAILTSRGLWIAAVALFVAACVYAYIRLPKRPSGVWLVLALAAGSGLLAEGLGGNFALITIPRELGNIGTLALMVLGLVTLLHVRTGPTWPVLGIVVAIHLPILHVQGPHYFYWPAALWGVFNASLLMSVWRRCSQGTLQWAQGARAVASEPDPAEHP